MKDAGGHGSDGRGGSQSAWGELANEAPGATLVNVENRFMAAYQHGIFTSVPTVSGAYARDETGVNLYNLLAGRGHPGVEDPKVLRDMAAV
jgi:hypothetical protein